MKKDDTSLFSRIKKLFIRGLFSLLPIILTYYISYLLIIAIYNFFDFSVIFLPKNLRQILPLKMLTVALTVVLFCLLAILTGYATKTFFGRQIRKMIQAIFFPIPIVNNIYKSIRQLFKLISQSEKQTFAKVVFVEFPHKNKWVLAFLTGKCSKKMSPKKDKTYYTVFMPTTPNPTTGFVMIVEEDDIIEADLSMDEAVKIIFSGGIVKDNDSFEEFENGSIL